VQVDPTCMCELLVGLPEVNVLGVIDSPGGALRVVIETREPRPVCPGCGGPALIKDRPPVELVDLAVFGRRARLVWRKHRWACPAGAARWVRGPGSSRRSPLRGWR
jgi:transposase IS204/IS1001/IS1096/IS1165 family protein